MKVSDALLGDFGSHPSDQDLILTYLRPRVSSGALERTWEFIHNADVYSADPADLTARFRPAIASNGEKAWYFFSPLRTKARGRRKARTVGDGEGCWHSEHALRGVFAGIRRSRQIGRRQSFSFVRKVGTQRIRLGWLMVEIRLNANDVRPGANERSSTDEHPSTDEPPSEIVLCKVYRSPRAMPARNPTKPSTAAASSGRKRKADDGSSDEANCVRLCTRCRTEVAESESQSYAADDDSVSEGDADEDKPQRRSESGVLEDGCSMSGQSDATHGDETVVSSENRGKPASLKLHDFFH